MQSTLAKTPSPPPAPSRASAGFWVSFVANVLLLGLVAALLLRLDRARVPNPTRTAAVSAPVPPVHRETATAADAPSPALEPGIRSAIAELESLGYERGVLAQALIEDFAGRWDQRFMELHRKHGFRPVPEREAIELGRQRDAEQIRELKEALGEEGYVAWDKERMLGLMNTGRVAWNDGEAAAVYRLQKEFDQKHRELQMAMEDGVADPADGATLQQQAYDELNRKLAELLGPERFEKMRGAGEPIDEIAWKFAHLGPTPEQAQEILQAQAAHREREAVLIARLKENPAATVNLTAELKAISDAEEENLRRIFGTETYETQKRESDPTYRKLRQFAAAWDLKDQEVESIYETLHALHAQTERTRAAAELRATAGQRVNWREIDAASQQAQQQAELGLEALIGAERLRRMKQNGVLSTVRLPR